MKRIGIVLIAIFLGSNGASGFIIDEEIFSRFSVDSLAARDDQGLLHQMPTVRATDFDRRYTRRWIYYFKGNEELTVATRLRRRTAKGFAPARLLLRPD